MAAFFYPALSSIIQNISSNKDCVRVRIKNWIASISRPPKTKLITIFETFLHWFIVAPLTLGLLYELVFVKSSDWFANDNMYRIDFKTVVLSWFMGTVALNTWSYMMYSKFFTTRFWTNIGNGILEPPFNEDGNPNPNANARDRMEVNEENALEWQGVQGRIANFFKTVKCVIFDWEWEAVDRSVLIDEFALPTTREVTSTFVGSLVSYRIVFYMISSLFKSQHGIAIPFFGIVENGTVRKCIFRFCMMVHVLFQIGSRSNDKINLWFECAHGAARDDRYLIGEILLNYADHPK